MSDYDDELYQQVLLEHNKNPKNFFPLENPTHVAEGDNPICGDHYKVFLHVGADERIEQVSFEGAGCAISKSSASLMTTSLKGKTVAEAQELFNQFHLLATGKLDPTKEDHNLGKLSIFKGIWKYPSRVKCAILCWHAMHNALEGKDQATTE